MTLRFYRDASRSQTPVSTPQHPSLPAFPSDNKKSSFFTDKTAKFANFFNQASTSQPELTFTTKPKQLRAEAKEMVRSLQASRSSLENGKSGSDSLTKTGSNASGGGGSRRKIRPFSPARAQQQQQQQQQLLQPNPICNSASAPSPFTQHLFDTLATSPAQSPTIESPMTPATSQPDFGRTNFEDLSLGVRGLQIEELPSDENLAGKSSFSSYSSSSTNSDYLHSSFGAKFDRPTELDLFSNSGRKQQGFIFNK